MQKTDLFKKKLDDGSPVYSGKTNSIFNRHVTLSILSFTFLAILFSTLIYQRYLILKQTQKKQAYDMANIAKDKLQEVLAYSLSATKTLSFFIDNNGTVKDFDSVAVQILNTNKDIDALELVPDGVIKYIYPLKGNENVIGYNILIDSTRNKEAFKAIEKRELFFSGPFELKQGGFGIVGRLPVFRNEKFWGFSAVVIKMATLLKAAGIDSTGSNGYYYQLSKINPDTKREEFFIRHEKEPLLGYTFSVDVPNGEWRLSVAPVAGFKGSADISILAILGFLFSVLGGIFIFIVVRRPEKLDRLVKERTRQLKESEENYKLLFQKSPLPLWIYDLETFRFLEVNDAAVNLYGYSREEFSEMDLFTIRPEDEIDKFIELARQGTDQLRESGPWAHIKKNKEEIQVLIFSRNIFYKGKQGRLVLVMDVSEKIKVENELIKSEEKYRLLIEQASDGIILYSFDGTIHSFNKAVYTQTGYTREEFEKLNLKDLFFEEGFAKSKPKDEKIRSDKATTLYRKLKKKDGSVFVVELNATMLPDGKIIAMVRDITEREKIETALKESESKYRTIIEQASDGIFIADEDALIIEVNNAGCRMLGYTKDELLKMKYTSLLPPEYLLNNPVQIDQLKDEGAVTNERRLLRKDGSLIEVEISAKVLFDGRYQSIIRDITERKKTDRALRENEEKYRTLVENAPEALVVFDVEKQKFISVSESATKLFRMSKEELLKLGPIAISPEYQPDGRLSSEAAVKNIQKTIEGEKIVFEWMHCDKTGNLIPCEVWLVRLPSETEVLIRGSIIDITERKKAAEKLYQSEEKYRLLFYNNPLPMWMATIPGLDIIDVNESAIKHYGYTREEFLKLNTRDLRPAEDVENFLKEVDKMEPGIINIRPWRHKKKDGTIIQVETYSHQIMYEERMVWLGLSNDVTEKYKAKELLQRSYEDIRQLASNLQSIREDERTNIAREIHDELGQQLTGLKMDMHWLARKIKNTDDEVNKKMQASIELINATITSVRKIATDLRPSILDDLGLLAALEWQSEEFAKRSGTKVKFINNAGDITVLPEVATALFRIYQELLTNIARHANAGLVTASLYIEDKRLYFSIADDGVGFNTDTIGKKKTLGLLGIKERTLLIGGAYEIKTQPGEGSETIISMPLNLAKSTD